MKVKDKSVERIRADKKIDGDFILASLIYKKKECEVCRKKHNEANMVLCDRCEDAFHIKCVLLDHIPKGTWICLQCTNDLTMMKNQQMAKRSIQKMTSEECGACKEKRGDFFYYEQAGLTVQSRFINMVTCSYCKGKFHSLCFSQRMQAINCSTCQQSIRDGLPKGYTHFVRYAKQSRTKIACLNFLQLSEGIENEKSVFEYGSMPCLGLKAPEKPQDWRTITCYYASLYYAIETRGLILCSNVVIETRPDKIETVLRAHKISLQKFFRLHRTDEIVYQNFKDRLENGYVPALEIREDRRLGFYMASTSSIPANTIIAEYTGELITARESLNMINNESIFTLIRNPRSYDSLDIAPSRFANVAIFISGINNNDKNAEQLQNVKALKFLYKGIARLILVTIRDIVPHQTLYLNYNGDRAVSEYPTSSFVH